VKQDLLNKQARKGFRPLSAIFVIQNQFEVFYFQVLRLNCISNKLRILLNFYLPSYDSFSLYVLAVHDGY
jgi:hypothetical protein